MEVMGLRVKKEGRGFSRVLLSLFIIDNWWRKEGSGNEGEMVFFFF